MEQRPPSPATLLTYYMWTVSGVNQHLIVSVRFAFHLLRAVARGILCSAGRGRKPRITPRGREAVAALARYLLT